MKHKIDLKAIAMKTAGLGAGGVAVGMLQKHLPDSIPEKIRPLIFIALGAFAPTFAKSSIVGHFGDGMIASGANQLVKTLMPNLVSGIDEEYLISGPASISDIDMEDGDIPGSIEGVESYEADKSFTI